MPAKHVLSTWNKIMIKLQRFHRVKWCLKCEAEDISEDFQDRCNIRRNSCSLKHSGSFI